MYKNEIDSISKDLEKLEAHICINCDAKLMPAGTVVGLESKWFYECVNPMCNTVVNTKFEPTDYQLDFLSSPGQLNGYFGGFGSGKTASSCMRFILHMLEVPRGESVFGAMRWALIYKSNMKEINEVLPMCLVQKFDWSPKSDNGGMWMAVLNNGHFSYARLMDKEGPFRSSNLTGYGAEEASEMSYGMYNQLNTRLRSDFGRTYETDENGAVILEQYVDPNGFMRTRKKEGPPFYLGILSSNPDPGWIRTKVIYETPEHQIHYYGPSMEHKKALSNPKHEKNPYVCSYVVSTYSNYHLPPDFIEKNIAGKTADWVDRYINGSFMFADGLVYPQWANAEVERFPIPRHGRRIISADFGRRDATAYIVGAIDPDNDVVYLYDEFYLERGDWPEGIAGFRSIYNSVEPTAWLYPPIGDPSGQSAGQADKRSWFDLYAEYGIYFIPSRTGKSSELGIASGISLVSEYFNSNKLKFFSDLENFRTEVANYKYKTVSLMEEAQDIAGEKPVGGRDHLMDALRGLVSMLPRNMNTNLSSITPTYVKNPKIWDNPQEFGAKTDKTFEEFGAKDETDSQFYDYADLDGIF